MDFSQSFLQYAIMPSQKSKPKVQEFVCRDELNKKPAPLKAKKKVHFESKLLLQSDKNNQNSATYNENFSRAVAVNEEKSRIRVKIMMTKEEAARLLSKCKDGGVLEFKDVADELLRIPNNRVDVVSNNRKDK